MDKGVHIIKFKVLLQYIGEIDLNTISWMLSN